MPAPRAPYLRFQEGYSVDEATGCWLWTGMIERNGYGTIKVFGKFQGAHRLSYELHHGPIPAGMYILHTCDVKRCVNPDHIRAGTPAENIAEAVERGLIRRGPAHPLFGRPNPRRGDKSSQSVHVLVLGKPYGSINEAERMLGLGSGTINFWVKFKPSKARILTAEEYRSHAQ